MTTPTEATKAEIRRFLGGDDPGVLCITGNWGVGKTFIWRSILDDLRKSNDLSITRYSYVSLFGLGSLDDLKSSIFENMEWLDHDATSFEGRGKAAAKALAARAKKLSELAGALPYVGPFVSKARPLFFSAVQNQIVCVDDLERRSEKLQIKDVLGLVSFLREQRGCKVALILNDEKLGENKADFDNLLEKVVETKVLFSPTPSESTAIALSGKDHLSEKLRGHCETLGIRNIRIIKQIERLARRIDELLADFPQQIKDQATHSLTLFGWSKFDREHAIAMNFFKESFIVRHMARRRGEPGPPEEAAWESQLQKYQFNRADEFDLSLMRYVETMVLDPDLIMSEARKLQEQQRRGELQGGFEAAWRTFHDSFEGNEEQVVQSMVTGAKRSFEVISLGNLNEIVLLLKKLGRNAEASDVLRFFAEYRNEADYWTERDSFARGPLDPDVVAAIEQKKPIGPAAFDVAAGLVKAGADYDSDVIAKLAIVPAETYRDLILAARGLELRSLVLSALEFRRISNASDDMRQVVARMEEALKMVGRMSRLNALRVHRFGVSTDD